MELAIFLGISAFAALAALVVQGRPSRRRRYREDAEWEISAYVADGDATPRQFTAKAPRKTSSAQTAPAMARAAMTRAAMAPKTMTLEGAKALSVSAAKSPFWTAIREDQPQQ